MTEGADTGVDCEQCGGVVSMADLGIMAKKLDPKFSAEQVRSAVLYGLIKVRHPGCVHAV